MVDSSSFAEGRNIVGLSVGAQLGDYRLEELLEKREAGQVFLARNNVTGAQFHLHILSVPSDIDPEARLVYLGYFQKQANQVAALEHPFILPLLHYGTYQGLPYLVYPYYAMQSLSRHLAQHGPLDAQRAGYYLDQVAAALECGHQRGILHRNLNTDCIFIKRDGNLLVADFGMLHMLAQRGEYQHGTAPAERAQGAKQNLLFGMNESSSPAPEQVLGNPVDAATDVYALGAALYRMLTGHRVFRGKTREEIAQQHLNAPVPPLNTWRRDLPAALDNVIARAMAKDPRQRFARPGELANAYHQVVAPYDSKRQPFTTAPAPALAPLSKAQPASAAERYKQAPIPRRKALTFLVAGGSAAAAITVVSIVGIHFLQGNNTSTGGTATTTANGPAPSSTRGSTAAAPQGKVLAHVSDLPTNSDKQFPLSNSSNPGLLIHLPDNRFVAFDSTCTHAGCAVKYNTQNKLLECPCHGAVFDPAKNAAVVQGPAQTPLSPVAISVNADGSITTNGS